MNDRLCPSCWNPHKLYIRRGHVFLTQWRHCFYSFLVFNSGGVLANFILRKHSLFRFLFLLPLNLGLQVEYHHPLHNRHCLPYRMRGIIQHFHRLYIMIKCFTYKLYIGLRIGKWISVSVNYVWIFGKGYSAVNVW